VNNDFRKQVYNNLNLKETDELVEIWQNNDRVEWSEDTFSIIQGILKERLGELPSQNEPILEYTDDNIDDVNDDESGFEFPIDNDNPPEFYNPHEVLRLEKWINWAAIASVVASIVSSLLELQRMHFIVWGFFMNNVEKSSIAWLITIVVFVFVVGLQCIVIYFPIKALGSILKILMEMEFNSRGAAKAKNA
jgi:hypothetical protein